MPPHNSRLRKYGLVALALGDINVDVVVGTRSTGCPDFAKLVESFEAKNAPQRHGVKPPAPVTAAVEVIYCWCVNEQQCLQRELRLSMHAMRAVSIIAVLLLLVANALQLLPVASPFEPYLSGGALVLGLVALVTILAGRVPERDTRAAAEAARPMPVPTGANYQADAEIVSFLAMLQARGRLVDFLMDDINMCDDAQVGAAARVVHAGCKAALLEHFRISPVRAESEGATVQVAAAICRTNTDWWARSAVRRRSLECSSITVGRRMR